jgi:hypothetical protein
LKYLQPVIQVLQQLQLKYDFDVLVIADRDPSVACEETIVSSNGR